MHFKQPLPLQSGAVLSDYTLVYETYGTLKLTEEGEQFLLNPTAVMLTQNHDYDKMQIEETESNISLGSKVQIQ